MIVVEEEGDGDDEEVDGDVGDQGGRHVCVCVCVSKGWMTADDGGSVRVKVCMVLGLARSPNPK